MKLTLAPSWRRFARNEDGSVTIEAVLWFPMFIWLMMIIADASLAFFAKAEAFRIIQDGNRAFSTKALKTPGEVEAWVLAQFKQFSDDAVAVTDTISGGAIVRTRMAIPVDDVVLFNTLGVSWGWNINVRSQHYIEVK
jgi:Flp pilus assembly protein TadG